MNYDIGFFFEPNDKGLIKLLNETPGFTYKQTLPDGRETSIPRSHAQNPTDTIPTMCIDAMRVLLSKTLPRFQSRDLLAPKVCWCADTMDREWLLTPHPVHERLVMGTGDSGNAFKQLPVIGKYIGDIVQGKSLEPVLQETWRWRSDKKPRVPRLGGDGKIRDLKDVDGWKGSGSSVHKL